MELGQLRYVAAVAGCGSFTRAADQCGVTQPTLSQQLAKLERELGQPLFHRLPGGAELTDAGRAFLDRVGPALALLDDARECVTHDAAAGRLTVAAIPTVAPYLLPAAVVAFTADFPQARLEILELTTAECAAALAAGSLDLAVLARPVPGDGFHAADVVTEELLLAVPAGHPLGRGPSAALAAVRDEAFVMLHEAHCLSGQAAAFCARHLLAPVVTARLHQLGTVLELVRLGRGVSLVPAMAAAQDRDPGRTYVRLTGGEVPARTVAAAWAKGRFRSPLSAPFVAALKAAAGAG